IRLLRNLPDDAEVVATRGATVRIRVRMVRVEVDVHGVGHVPFQVEAGRAVLPDERVGERTVGKIATGIHQVRHRTVGIDGGTVRILGVVEPGTEGVPVYDVLVVRVGVVRRRDYRVHGL